MSADLLKESIAAFGDQPIDEILIWDNASGAHEMEKLQQIALADNRVRVFASAENIGFGAAMNALGDVATQHDDDIIWILNPDTRLIQGSVDGLREFLLHGPYDIVSALLVSGETSKPSVWFNGGGIDVKTGRCWHNDYGMEKWRLSPASTRTEFMTGAAPMMTRRVWDKLGGFHEELFLYWEDVELSLRAADLGISMAVFHGCVIWHLEGGSGGSNEGHSIAYHYYNARNRLRVCGARSGKVKVALGPGLRETVAAVLRPLSRERDGKMTKSLAALRGSIAGLFGRGTLGSRRRVVKADVIAGTPGTPRSGSVG
jgi:GT2 family glycosyltransferase